ncbi:hypothetical protein V8E55_009023 [Tylopilus felleus]
MTELKRMRLCRQTRIEVCLKLLPLPRCFSILLVSEHLKARFSGFDSSRWRRGAMEHQMTPRTPTPVTATTTNAASSGQGPNAEPLVMQIIVRIRSVISLITRKTCLLLIASSVRLLLALRGRSHTGCRQLLLAIPPG